MQFLRLFVILSTCLFGSYRNQECNMKVMDDTKENAFISDLNLFDRYGSTINQNKQFNLLSNAKVNGLFRLERSGKLYSAKLIDREQLCKDTEHCCDNKDPCTILLSIAVKTEALVEPRTFECRVLVMDINDNAPEFPKEKKTISIKESESVGSTFPLPFAIDLDSDKFSVRDYKLEERSSFPPTFSLDQHRPSTNLNLKLIQKLDREKRTSYELTILAIDHGNPAKTGKMIINVNVLDVNDNAPHLIRNNYVTDHDESKFTTQPLLTIEAKDDDENENAQLFFRIIDENPLKQDAMKYFRIEDNTGKIFLLQQLDFEKQESHRFFVEVFNRGSQVDTATATVLVNVVNLNDERPTISIDYLNNNNDHANIQENSSKVKFVAIATVVDKDKGIGGQVQCRLANFNNIFEIQSKDMSNVPNQYNILTKVPLDRESTSYYELEMECEDKGIPVLKEKANIKIKVDDVNDNSPIIKIDSKISVKENQPAGTLVTKITATDLDEGRNSELVFSITGSEEQSEKFLEINPHTGEMKTRVVIDRERDHDLLTLLQVVLTVSDKGQPPLSTVKVISVQIEDENDNSPEFANELIKFAVTENQPPKYTLGEIPITDRDDMSNLKVYLAHSPNEMLSPFVLFSKDNKYYLNTTRSLDWEKEQNFSLKVIASDGRDYKSNTVTATIFINVIDENDHAPMIIFPQQNSSLIHKISYLEKSDFVVLTVSAVDRDSHDNQNGKFYFEIMDYNKDLLAINSATGKITTTRPMNRNDIGRYSIKVLVRDQGTPSKESYITLTIEIDDSKSTARSGFNENGKDPSNGNIKDSESYISKERLLITSLIILLLFLLICIFMILYMRHIKGLFLILPDVFEGCSCFNDKRPKTKKNSIHKSICDIPIQESGNFVSRNSPLDFQQQVRNNESSLMPFYLNQYIAVDSKIPVNQFRQYETMKYHHYSPTVFNSKTVQNYNYDQLFYHHPSSSPCEDSFIVPIASSSNSNNFYDSRIKTIPTNLNRDMAVNCHRIINNIEPTPLITDDHYNENRKERFSSNPCLKSDQMENCTAEQTLAKTPDVRRHNRKNDKIDTYAVTYPKEQSTFV